MKLNATATAAFWSFSRSGIALAGVLPQQDDRSSQRRTCQRGRGHEDADWTARMAGGGPGSDGPGLADGEGVTARAPHSRRGGLDRSRPAAAADGMASPADPAPPDPAS